MWPFRKPKVMKNIRPEVGFLIRDLAEFPDEWNMNDKYWIVHKETGVKIWVANGRSYLKFDGGHENSDFTEDEKTELWKIIESRVLHKNVEKLFNHAKSRKENAKEA